MTFYVQNNAKTHHFGCILALKRMIFLQKSMIIHNPQELNLTMQTFCAD